MPLATPSEAAPAPVAVSRADRAAVRLPLGLVLFVLVLGSVGVAAATTDLAGLLGSVRDTGPAAPAVFTLAYAVGTLVGVPRNVLSATAGLVFGFWWGLPLAFFGSLLGATAGFWLARRLGRESVTRFGGTRTAAFDRALARRGFQAVLGARLTPLVPFTAFNYAAGLSSIDRRSYAAGTLIGVLPGTVGYVAAGAFATAPLPVMMAAAVGLLAVVCVGYLLRRRTRVAPPGAR